MSIGSSQAGQQHSSHVWSLAAGIQRHTLIVKVEHSNHGDVIASRLGVEYAVENVLKVIWEIRHREHILSIFH